MAIPRVSICLRIEVFSDCGDTMSEAEKTSWGASESELEIHFGRYVDRMLAGEVLDLEQVRRDHPESGDALVQQLRSFQDLLDASHSGDLSATTLGDYTVIRQAGRGGMGVVYEAWQNSLNRQVALKVLPSYVANNANAATRFIREAQIAARLSHPNIVQVFGMGVERHLPYYAMEFVDGETLRKFIARMRAMEPDERRVFSNAEREGKISGSRLSTEVSTLARTSERTNAGGSVERHRDYCDRVGEVFIGVAEGLHHAHEQGVTHRDIKPSNLIFDRPTDNAPSSRIRLRILDFGLASFEGQESLTATGELLGTIRYMSPEQASQRDAKLLDHRTDIYSLGVTLYEALTLQPAFPEGDVRETIGRIIESEPIAPRRLNPRISKDLETIILKCIRKEPKARYGSAAELAEDLRRHHRGEVILARPQSGQERVVRWCKRNRGLAVAISALAVMLFVSFLGFGFAALHFRQQEEAQRQLAFAVGLQFVDRLANDENSTSQQIRRQLVQQKPQRPGDPDDRNFAWHYHWNRLTNITPVYQDLGEAPVVAIGKNGNLLSLAMDLVVREWGVSGTTPIREMPLARQPHPNAFSLSPDGQTAAIANDADSIQVFRSSDGKQLQRFIIPSDTRPTHLVYSADSRRLMARLQRLPDSLAVEGQLTGKVLATGLEMEDRVWDVATGETVHRRRFAGPMTYKPNRWPAVSILSEGSTVLERFTEEGVVRIQRENTVESLSKNGYYVHSHAVSSDGQLCAVGDVRGIVTLWDVSTQKPICELTVDEVSVSALAFTPDANHLAAGGFRGKITLWDVTTGRKLAALKAHTDELRQLEFSADSDKLVSLDWSGAAQVWELDTLGQTGLRIDKEITQGTGKSGYSPDGKWLTVIQGQTIDLWATHLMRRVHQLPVKSAFCSAFSPDSKTLITGSVDGVIRFWDVETGQERVTLTLEGQAPKAGIEFTVNSLDVSADGRYLAASFGWPHQDEHPASPQDVTVWSLDTGRVVAAFPHGNLVMKVAFSKDAGLFATACYDGALRIWETTNWKQTHLLRADSKLQPGLMSIAFVSQNAQRRIAAGDFWGNIHVWDLETRSKINTLRGHPTQCLDLETSPDQRVLASGGYDGTVRIWDLATGRELCVLRGHHATWVSSVSFSPDGTTLTSQSFADGVARQWPTTPSFWSDLENAVNGLVRIRRESPYEPLGLSLLQTARAHPQVWRLLAERLPDDPVVIMGLAHVLDEAGEKEEASEAHRQAIRRLSVLVEANSTNVPLMEIMTDLLLDQVGSQYEWTVLNPSQAKREAGNALTVLSDGTVVVDGDARSLESFVLQASGDLSNISAFKIDTIPDPNYRAPRIMTPAFQFDVELLNSNEDQPTVSLQPTSLMVAWNGKSVMPALMLEDQAESTTHICLTNAFRPASIVIAARSVQDATSGNSLRWRFRTRPLHGKLCIKATTHPNAYFHEWLSNDRDLNPRTRLAATYFLMGEWQKSLGILRSLGIDQVATVERLLVALCLSKIGDADEAVTYYNLATAELAGAKPTSGLSLLEQLAAVQFAEAPSDQVSQEARSSLVDDRLAYIEGRLDDGTMQPWEPWLYLQYFDAGLRLGLGSSKRFLNYGEKIVDWALSRLDYVTTESTLALMLRGRLRIGESAPQELDRLRFRLWQVRDRLRVEINSDGLLPDPLDHPLRAAEIVETYEGSQVELSELLRGPVVTLFAGTDPKVPQWQVDRIRRMREDSSQLGLQFLLVAPSETSLAKLRETLSIPEDWIVLINDIPTLVNDQLLAVLTIDGKFQSDVVSWWLLEAEVRRRSL